VADVTARARVSASRHVVWTQTAAPHVIYVPDRFAASTTARCDGPIESPRDPATGLVEVACSGVLEVGPRAP